VGEVRAVRPEGGAEIWEFSAPEAVLRYAVEKGSVSVDGISLTIASIEEASFTVSILPQTKEVTNLHSLSPGDRVNLEADIIAKYVERLLGKSLQTFERSVEDAV
jgi:riboflavin synthase